MTCLVPNFLYFKRHCNSVLHITLVLSCNLFITCLFVRPCSLTTLDEFENGGFTPKTHQMLSVHATPEEFKNTTITSLFGFVFEEKHTQGNHIIIARSSFSKSSVFKMFSVHTKIKIKKIKCRHPIWRVFLKSSVFETDWTIGNSGQ